MQQSSADMRRDSDRSVVQICHFCELVKQTAYSETQSEGEVLDAGQWAPARWCPVRAAVRGLGALLKATSAMVRD